MTRSRAVAVLLVAALAAATLFLGAARADIQEQRRRLPPPVDPQTCSDPIAGEWRAQPFYPDGPLWMLFELHLERVPGDARALRGTLHVDYWRGGPRDAVMPACGAGVYRKALGETVAGTLDGTHVRLQSSEWHPVPGGCLDVGDYILDGFDGTVDEARQEMQTRLLGPGGIGDQEPAVYRRVACPGVPPGVMPPEADVPPATPPPPAPTLAGRRLGCGC